MEIIFNSLYKIDLKEEEVNLQSFEDQDNLNNYILELLEKVSNEEGDREYNFADGSLTMKSLLNNIILNQSIETACKTIAERLLESEKKGQIRINRLGKEIQKGMLIISYVQMTETEKKIILSKADYDEFLEEVTGNKKSGLPIKKKIYKAFIANVSMQGGAEEITKLLTYDSNTKNTEYWWKDFLELVVLRNSEENTIRAFGAIESDILTPISKKYKQDYLHLWNATIAYFRANGDFNFNNFRDNIIINYQPFDEGLKINDLTTKFDKLPSKYKFDNVFEKLPSAVKKRFKNILSLTNEIDLVLKHDVANMKIVFKPHADGDGKYLMIKSDVGYEYAKRQQNINLENE